MMSINVQTTNKALSAVGGLLPVAELMKRSQLASCLEGCLPSLKSGAGRSYQKFQDLVLGFAAGAECLDDMEMMAADPAFSQLCGGEAYTAKSYGDFLRSFTGENIWHAQAALMDMSLALRRNLFPDADKLVFDCDSTPNPQTGKKMEGVAINYKGISCLDTLNIFDAHGLQYYTDVRAGNTYTSQGILDPIHRLFSRVHAEFAKAKQKCPKILMRADSGFYNVEFVNACVAKNADVLLAVKKITGFSQIVGQVHNWQVTNHEDKDRIKFYDDRECEIGSTNYRMKGCVRRLRYVIMRAERERSPLMPNHVEYDYYAFCTTYSEALFSNEDVIRKYRKRGKR